MTQFSIWPANSNIGTAQGRASHYALDFMGSLAGLIGKHLGTYGGTDACDPVFARVLETQAFKLHQINFPDFDSLLETQSPLRGLKPNVSDYYNYLYDCPHLSAGFKEWKSNLPSISDRAEELRASPEKFAQHLSRDIPLYFLVFLREPAPGEGVLVPLLPQDFASPFRGDNGFVFGPVEGWRRHLLSQLESRVGIGYVGKACTLEERHHLEGIVYDDTAVELYGRGASETPLTFDLYLGGLSAWILPLVDPIIVEQGTGEAQAPEPIGVIYFYSPIRGLTRVARDAFTRSTDGVLHRNGPIHDLIRLFVRRHSQWIETRRSPVYLELPRHLVGAAHRQRDEQQLLVDVAERILANSDQVLSVKCSYRAGSVDESRETLFRSSTLWQALETTLEFTEYVGANLELPAQEVSQATRDQVSLAPLPDTVGQQQSEIFSAKRFLNRLRCLEHILGLDLAADFGSVTVDKTVAVYWTDAKSNTARADKTLGTTTLGTTTNDIERELRGFIEHLSSLRKPTATIEKEPMLRRAFMAHLLRFLRKGHCGGCDALRSARCVELGVCQRIVDDEVKQSISAVFPDSDDVPELVERYVRLAQTGLNHIALFSMEHGVQEIPTSASSSTVNQSLSDGLHKIRSEFWHEMALKEDQRRKPALGGRGTTGTRFEGFLHPGDIRPRLPNPPPPTHTFRSAGETGFIKSTEPIADDTLFDIFYLDAPDVTNQAIHKQVTHSGWLHIVRQHGADPYHSQILVERLDHLWLTVLEAETNASYARDQHVKNLSHTVRHLFRGVSTRLECFVEEYLPFEVAERPGIKSQIESILSISSYGYKVIDVLELLRATDTSAIPSNERDSSAEATSPLTDSSLKRTNVDLATLIKEQVDIVKTLIQTAPAFTEIPQNRLDQLEVEINGCDAPLLCSTHETLLQLIVTDFTINAYKYARLYPGDSEKNKIVITLEQSPLPIQEALNDSTEWVLSVETPGQFPRTDIDNIWRLRGRTDHAGLGLKIALQVCSRIGWTIPEPENIPPDRENEFERCRVMLRLYSFPTRSEKSTAQKEII